MVKVPEGMVRKDFVVCSSVLDRLTACPGSGVYDAVAKEKITFPQWYGIFVHRFLEYCVTQGHAYALAYVRTKNMPSVIKCCEAIDPDALYYGQAEVGWCHNPFEDTSRRLFHGEWDSIDARVEQFGKADIVVEEGVDLPMIGDYKCGEIDKMPAERSQMMGLASSYRAEAGVKELDISIAEVRSSGEINWYIQTVDDQDLKRYIDHTRDVQLRIVDDRKRADRGHDPEFVKGDQCKWCKLKPVCPAWK